MSTPSKIELYRLGYRPGPPSIEVGVMDCILADKMKCPECGVGMHYEPWTKDESYRAFAICPNCGHRVEL